MQKFRARDPFLFTNGAIGWRPGGPFDALGPFAKVEQCPIAGTTLRRTCYATDYADTFYSVPAVCRIRGHRINGFFMIDKGACIFHVLESHQHFLASIVKLA